MERFSLLLLEPGEIYFEDFSAHLFPQEILERKNPNQKIKGRLKICSKSLIFDPKDIHSPILRFPFRDILNIEKVSESEMLRYNAGENLLSIVSEQCIEMKESNIIGPYRFRKVKKKYVFSLVYAHLDDVLPQSCQLHRASTLPIADQSAMINAIVAHRQKRVSFDASWLENLHENIIVEVQGDRITPLVTNPGRILLTNTRLYIQPFNNVDPVPVIKIKLSTISRVIKRRYLLRQIGLEIYCKDSVTCPYSHLYLAFKSEKDRNEMYDQMLSQSAINLEEPEQENMTLRWQNGAISNYDYLTYLNSMADRSDNDLTQYPVFPWVICDYTSSSLDLNNKEVYRDLTKPIGALNKDRLCKLMERFCDMPEPKFLYGSHYSTPGYVLYYLVRTKPEFMLCLQNGRFDQPDRMFNSMEETWSNCMTSYSDFKELIPEFYNSNGDFLKNTQGICFGNRQDGRPVGNVELPVWATHAKDFVHKMREALESDYVSENLHHWIDLIFGYKQTGDQAENSYNLYYYLTYEGAVDLDSITDLNERSALEQQITEFGQTPRQLFKCCHPQRRWPKVPSALSISNNAENPQSECVDGEESLPNSWPNMTKLEMVTHHLLHKESVLDVKWSNNCEQIYSASKDSMLKVYNLEERQQQRSINITNMPLSSVLVLPNMKTIIIGSWDNNIYVYSMEYGRVLDTIFLHDDAVSCLDFHENILVSSSWDATVKIYESSECQTKYSIVGELDHDTAINCVKLSTDGKQLVSCTKDGLLCVWDVNTTQLLSQHKGHIGSVNAVSFSPDDQRLISCGDDGSLQVIDLPSGTQVFTKNAGEALTSLDWDGRCVLTGGQQGNIHTWDLDKASIVATTPVHNGAVNCLSVGPAAQVVTGGTDRMVKVWTPS